MEAAYFQTYFLAQAIEKVKSTDADALIFEGLPGQEFTAPQGPGQDRREEPPHLAVGAHRQGQRPRAVRHRLDREERIRPDPWVDLLYPNKDCDFTNPKVLERLKSNDPDRSGTIDL